MEAGALKIQAIARGRKQRRGNRRIGSAKKLPNKKSEEELASAKLQAIQRGRRGRKRVEEMKEQRKSANKLQAIQRGRADRRRVAAKKTGGFVLEDKDIRAGLSQLARNPFTLKHSYVKLELGDKQLKDIGAVEKYQNLQTLLVDDNYITDLR